MTDSDTGAATPGGDQTTEQSNDSQVTVDDVAQSIRDTRHDLGAGHAKALDRLESEYGVSTEKELYQALGFPGELVTIELQVFDAELYLLADLLDKSTKGQTPAYNFVPLANLQDTIIDQTPPETIHAWATEESDDRISMDTLEESEGTDE